jgi:hypothetical protein
MERASTPVTDSAGVEFLTGNYKVPIRTNRLKTIK